MRHKLLIGLAVLGLGACTGDAPTSPAPHGGAAVREIGLGYYPGQQRTEAAVDGKFVPLNCVPKEAAEGSAEIGPVGGTLQIGPHRLVIPAGALDKKVLISGTIPKGRSFDIDLQPHGLQFRIAAGLVLDASSCTDVPAIVYIIDQYTVSDPIEATYSEWWKTIAAPIWHFSGYAIAF